MSQGRAGRQVIAVLRVIGDRVSGHGRHMKGVRGIVLFLFDGETADTP